jgi:hypothetical protein
MMTVVSVPSNRLGVENGRLIKNIYLSTQADSPKNIAIGLREDL